LIVSNVQFINPITSTTDKVDIEITEGRIVSFASPGSLKDRGDGFIDATGLYASPGFIDIHSHFRDPGFTYKEDIVSGAAAAARGGYTDIVLMANTNPTVDDPSVLAYVYNKGLETGIHIHSCASVTKGLKGTELTDMETLKKHGAVGFTDDGIPIMDEEILRKAMKYCADLNVPISLHEEDKNLISQNGINAGSVAIHYGLLGAPREAEINMVKRDIDIAIETGVKLDIQHVSAKETVKLVRAARNAGHLNICAEATPHHFSLTEKAILEHGSNAKMNPPLRTEEDRQAIIEGLKDGTISFIATDHAPHSIEEKQGSLTSAPSGIIGLETAFSLGLTKLVRESDMSIYSFISKLTVEPRKFYGFKIPSLAIGDAADITVFSLSEEWTYDKTLSRSFNTPFAGCKMTGKVKYTICGGRTVFCDR